MAELVEGAEAAAKKAAAKKGKKGEAPELPRFGRVRSNLKMGILGLPNVGKSSLFNLLTEQSAAAEFLAHQKENRQKSVISAC